MIERDICGIRLPGTWKGFPTAGLFFRGQRAKRICRYVYGGMAAATHSETGEKYVVYQAMYGQGETYIRPYVMFVSKVDHAKYPRIEQKYRLELVR